MINRFKAFTLIELLVVVAVIGAAAGISLVGFKALQPSVKLRSALQLLVVDLRYAEQLAVTEQLDYGVQFSTTTGEYRLLRHSTTTEEFLVKSLPEGISFHEITGFTDNEAVFNPYGAVRETGTVSLQNSKMETRTIEIRPSGFVKIQE